MAAESFVGRWSRLKRRAEPSAEPQKQPETLEDSATSTVVPAMAAVATATRSGASLDAAGKSTAPPAGQSSGEGSPAGRDVAGEAQSGGTRPLPDIESLGADSDLSMFMTADVDPQLRVRALKKLFADPHFNRMDGLDIYIDDYSKPDPMPLAFIRRLAQSRILGLSDEPAPDHAVPGDVDATIAVEMAAAADEAAMSNGAAEAGGMVPAGAVRGTAGALEVSGAVEALETSEVPQVPQAPAGLDRTA